MMIASQVMKLLIDKYEDFILEYTYLNDNGIRIYILRFDDDSTMKCKVEYEDFARIVEL